MVVPHVTLVRRWLLGLMGRTATLSPEGALNLPCSRGDDCHRKACGYRCSLWKGIIVDIVCHEVVEFQLRSMFCGNTHRINHFLQRYLIRRLIKPLFSSPAQIAHRPTCLLRIDPAVLQHEGADLLSMHAQAFDGRRSCVNQIAHCLASSVRQPDRR